MERSQHRPSFSPAKLTLYATGSRRWLGTGLDSSAMWMCQRSCPTRWDTGSTDSYLLEQATTVSPCFSSSADMQYILKTYPRWFSAGFLDSTLYMCRQLYNWHYFPYRIHVVYWNLFNEWNKDLFIGPFEYKRFRYFALELMDVAMTLLTFAITTHDKQLMPVLFM